MNNLLLVRGEQFIYLPLLLRQIAAKAEIVVPEI